MKQRNPYYKLDEIGFVGTQKKRSAAQVKKDVEIMEQFIKADKSGQPFRRSKKAKISNVTK